MRTPLEVLLDEIADAAVEDDEATLRVPEGLGDDDRTRFIAYVGLVDLVAEASIEAVPAGERASALARALQTVIAAEGPLRFAHHERVTTAERQELVARMRGKDIAMTSEWLVPRLSGDIDTYRQRIEALERRIAERR